MTCIVNTKLFLFFVSYKNPPCFHLHGPILPIDKIDWDFPTFDFICKFLYQFWCMVLCISYFSASAVPPKIRKTVSNKSQCLVTCKRGLLLTDSWMLLTVSTDIDYEILIHDFFTPQSYRHLFTCGLKFALVSESFCIFNSITDATLYTFYRPVSMKRCLFFLLTTTFLEATGKKLID